MNKIEIKKQTKNTSGKFIDVDNIFLEIHQISWDNFKNFQNMFE